MTPPTRPRVLIVDDEGEMLALLRLAMRDMPYEAVFVSHGIDALVEIFEAYRQEKPFCVMVLDCALPRIDGFTIAKMVRLAERTEITAVHARIGFFTAFPETVERSTLLQEVGAEAYWRKPEDVNDLPFLIASWLKVEAPRAGAPAVESK